MPIRSKDIGTGARYGIGTFDDDDDDDEFAERTFVDRRDPTLFPKHMNSDGTDLSEPTAADARYRLDNEVNEYDEMKHLQNLEESVWSEKELNTLQEGDRLGIGLTHEGYTVVDALESSVDSPFKGPDDGVQFEVVRQL